MKRLINNSIVHKRKRRRQNMPPEQTSLCDNCSGRWDRIGFWHSSPPGTEESQEEWGHVLDRKFGEIEKNSQCSFCQLICNALTKRGHSPIQKDTTIYFSKVLFGEYESRSTAQRGHGTASQFGGLEESTWQRHFVNRLCVSTFPSRTNLASDDIWLNQDETRLCQYNECHIALLRDDADNDRFFHGRRMNSTFDTNLAKQWIKTCDTAHSTECSLPCVVKRPSRVINVKEKCIEYTPPSCSYIALSYRWPTSAGLKLTNDTESSLMKDDGLAQVDGIPLIVEDAMTLLRSLGQTYLWVDALCISQQERDPQNCLDDEKEDQLAAMADIYRGSYFTIVACSDPDSKKGLAGIRGRTRHSQRSKNTDDLTFAIAKPDLVYAGQNSKWNSRVWTFQEAAQSRRLLIFTDDQVFFHCNGTIWREDTFLETSRLQQVRARNHPPPQAPYWRNRFPEQQLKLIEWFEVGKNYTARIATRDSDFPLGLEFIKQKNRTFCCLPEKYFALALCFITLEGKRRGLDSPTWCWCHWKVPGGIKYGLEALFFKDSADSFCSRSFYKIGYDLSECSLFPIRMNDVQFPSLLNAMQVSSIQSKFEIPNLVGFYAYMLKGRLSLGDGRFGEDYTIEFPLHPPVHASAVLALDFHKNEGDLVTCVDVVFDFDANDVSLLVVETNDNGISRRVGAATVNLIKWKLTTFALEKAWVFLE